MKKLVMFSKVLCVLISIICFVSFFEIPANAYSYTDSSKSSTSIAPTKKQFSSAEKPLYSKSSQTIYDSVSSKYSVDIYHYEAPKSGYYQIYTTGTTDTLGKVYEENSTLWFNIRYDQKANNDDSGEGRNFKIITEFDKYEDYYICARGYGSVTGSYTLSIKPNDDKVYSKVGGTWVRSSIDEKENGIYAKEYLNKDQAIAYFQLLRDTATTRLIKNYYRSNGVIGTNRTLLNAGKSYFSIVDTVLGIVDEYSDLSCSINPILSTGVSITSSTLGMIFDSCDEDVDSISELLAHLTKYAGITITQKRGEDVYSAKNGVCISHGRRLVTINNGVYRISYWSYYSDWTSYNRTDLVGLNYERGYWC